MRIGLVTGEYPPLEGGVGDFTRELGRALAEQDHRVHVITGQSPGTDSGAGLSGVVVHRIVRTWGWGCWRDVLRIARQEQLEVLNVQFQTAAYGMHPAIHLVPQHRRRPPIVVTFHDLKVPYLLAKAGPLRWWAVQTLARRADGVIVTNVEDEMRLSDLRPPISCLTRISIGSNIAACLPRGYDRDGWRDRWGVGPDDLLLGYFGFLNERKGGEDLIEVLAALVARGLPAHLLLIGGRAGSSDPTNLAYAERVERLVAERDLSRRVQRTGFVSPEEVSAALAAVDVCVLPYRDGVSLRHGSLHACLAHGRPVVTTRSAVEMPEFRDGESALLAPARDVEALTDCVARLAAQPDLQARLEAGAAALAAEFTWDKIARRTAVFLGEACRGK